MSRLRASSPHLIPVPLEHLRNTFANVVLKYALEAVYSTSKTAPRALKSKIKTITLNKAEISAWRENLIKFIANPKDPHIESEQSSADGYWECQSCTFVNSNKSQSCKICSNPNPKISSAAHRQCFYCKQSFPSSEFHHHLKQCPARQQKVFGDLIRSGDTIRLCFEFILYSSFPSVYESITCSKIKMCVSDGHVQCVLLKIQ